MRPITLTMAGLRSYRSERTIHFGDPGLIAIIGDTGAGKSSILEAITGALYGACTWDNRGIGELISDGVQTVQLELTFAVAGHTWTISRSASRNNYPPSRHVLHCHDTGEKLTGERVVTARITELLGLDTKQFLRVVVLPQNRFMELLNARRSAATSQPAAWSPSSATCARSRPTSTAFSSSPRSRQAATCDGSSQPSGNSSSSMTYQQACWPEYCRCQKDAACARDIGSPRLSGLGSMFSGRGAG
ncbi:MAG: AAA family ATPase, partial [Streptosporangiaceae bacterium]